MSSIQIGWNMRADPETRKVMTRKWADQLCAAGMIYGVEFAMPMLGNRWAAFTDDEINMILGWDAMLDQEFAVTGDPPKDYQSFLDEMEAELVARAAQRTEPA